MQLTPPSPLAVQFWSTPAARTNAGAAASRRVVRVPRGVGLQPRLGKEVVGIRARAAGEVGVHRVSPVCHV
jgi:hypothetical protein